MELNYLFKRRWYIRYAPNSTLWSNYLLTQVPIVPVVLVLYTYTHSERGIISRCRASKYKGFELSSDPRSYKYKSRWSVSRPVIVEKSKVI